jgi:hypothetical protein
MNHKDSHGSDPASLPGERIPARRPALPKRVVPAAYSSVPSEQTSL